MGQEAAVRVIEAAAAGEAPSPTDLQTLADLVLETPEVKAALEVRKGGPWALTRALELAGWVLEHRAEVELVDDPGVASGDS